MEADSSDSTHVFMAELGVSFNPATFDSLVDSLEDTSRGKRSKKTEGLSQEEADAKRRLWNKQERERQKAMKIAFRALRRILPENSMSGHTKGSKIWILETAIAYIGELTIQANRLNPEACRHLHENFQIVLRDRWYNKDADLASVSFDLQDTKDPPVLTAPSAPPMSANIPAPPMNPMPDDTLVSQPLATIHQNEQVPLFGQQNLSIDQATHHQPTVTSKPEDFTYGSSNPTCLWGGSNALPQTTILQDHVPGPHSSHPMNVPIQTELYPGESHMGPRHPNHGPHLMQHEFSTPSFSPYLPALASSVDCPPIFSTPNGHNFFHSTPKTHLPSPAYPTPIANRIMSESGYSGMASSNTFDSSINSNKSSKSRRRKTSTTFSPYSQDRTLDEMISFTYQPY